MRIFLYLRNPLMLVSLLNKLKSEFITDAMIMLLYQYIEYITSFI